MSYHQYVERVERQADNEAAMYEQELADGFISQKEYNERIQEIQREVADIYAQLWKE